MYKIVALNVSHEDEKTRERSSIIKPPGICPAV